MTLPIFQKDFEYTYQTHRAKSDIGKEKLKSLLKVLISNMVWYWIWHQFCLCPAGNIYKMSKKIAKIVVWKLPWETFLEYSITAKLQN